MTRYVYCNTSYVPYDDAFIPVEDRSVQFGDSIYEVIAYTNNHFIDLDPHLDRLETSLEAIKLKAPVSRGVLKVILNEVIRLNRIQTGNVYIQISRGCGPSHKRYFGFPSTVTPSLIVVARSFDHRSFLESKKRGISCITRLDPRWKRVDIKTTNLLAAVLAKQEAATLGVDDTIWVDDQNLITEATASNVWMIKGSTVMTRPAEGCILNGITRLRLLDLAKKMDLEVKEQAFSLTELYDADEAFLSSSNICVLPIASIDGKRVKNDSNFVHIPCLQRLYEEFSA